MPTKLIALVIVGVLAIGGTVAVAALQPSQLESATDPTSEITLYADEFIYVKMLGLSSMMFIQGMDLPNDLKTSLLSDLSEAIELSQDNIRENDRDACAKLDAFFSEVNTKLQMRQLSSAKAKQLEELVDPINSTLCRQ